VSAEASQRLIVSFFIITRIPENTGETPHFSATADYQNYFYDYRSGFAARCLRELIAGAVS
jgi:hypothetical protein